MSDEQWYGQRYPVAIAHDGNQYLYCAANDGTFWKKDTRDWGRRLGTEATDKWKQIEGLPKIKAYDYGSSGKSREEVG